MARLNSPLKVFSPAASRIRRSRMTSIHERPSGFASRRRTAGLVAPPDHVCHQFDGTARLSPLTPSSQIDDSPAPCIGSVTPEHIGDFLTKTGVLPRLHLPKSAKELSQRRGFSGQLRSPLTCVGVSDQRAQVPGAVSLLTSAFGTWSVDWISNRFS